MPQRPGLSRARLAGLLLAPLLAAACADPPGAWRPAPGPATPVAALPPASDSSPGAGTPAPAGGLAPDAALPAATLNALPCATLAATDAASEAARTAPPAVVVVAGGGDLWLWRDGEAEARRLALGDARSAWPSPDGTFVALVREGPPATPNGAAGPQSLWVLPTGGGEPRQVADSALLEADLGFTGSLASVYEVQWLPGSHSLTWRVSPRYVEGLGGPFPERIRKLDLDLGGTPGVLPILTQHAILRWSPNGLWAALGQSGAVDLVAADGRWPKPGRRIGVGVGMGDAMYTLTPTWSADSRRVVVAAPQANPHAGTGPYAGRDVPIDLVELALPDWEPRRLGRVRADLLAGQSLSPDLGFVAYRTGDEPDRPLDLRLADIAGTWTASLPAAAFVAWSPDSRHFLFRPDRPDSLFVGRLCGRAVPVQGSPGSDANGPARWLDAERFVFLDTDERDQLGRWHLRLGRLDGSSVALASFTHPERPVLGVNR